MTKTKTPLQELESKIQPINYTHDINIKKPFDLQKAIKAAQELRKMKSVFIDDDSLRAELIRQS